jgi:hypothetical protein
MPRDAVRLVPLVHHAAHPPPNLPVHFLAGSHNSRRRPRRSPPAGALPSTQILGISSSVTVGLQLNSPTSLQFEAVSRKFWFSFTFHHFCTGDAQMDPSRMHCCLAISRELALGRLLVLRHCPHFKALDLPLLQ